MCQDCRKKVDSTQHTLFNYESFSVKRKLFGITKQFEILTNLDTEELGCLTKYICELLNTFRNAQIPLTRAENGRVLVRQKFLKNITNMDVSGFGPYTTHPSREWTRLGSAYIPRTWAESDASGFGPYTTDLSREWPRLGLTEVSGIYDKRGHVWVWLISHALEPGNPRSWSTAASTSPSQLGYCRGARMVNPSEQFVEEDFNKFSTTISQKIWSRRLNEATEE